MDSTNSQRNKRTVNRPSRGSEDPAPVAEPKENAECPNVAALAISPIPAIIPVSECRRSSRKKIIKFDVRDLLNKNRKPHKIQIEARIDSNVPSTSKTTTAASGETTSKVGSGLAPGASGDLSSKQKTFMEKSAIFRRFSISQEQTKPPPPPIPPMPPTILGKVVGEKDAANSKDMSGKRINRTQEYYNNVMLKPKQTTSLIVAQMESNVRSVEVKQRKSCNKASSECEAKTEEMQHIITTQQKRRGRPPKTRQQEMALTDAASREENSTGEATHKITPEKATNWKEYKACLAQQTDNKDTIKETSETKNKEGLTITPNVNTQDSELESVVVIQTDNKIIIEKEDPIQIESKILQEESLMQLAKASKKDHDSEISQSKKESPVSEINEEQTGDEKIATECIYRIESKKEIKGMTAAKSASTDDKNEEKLTQILSRESSLSESENSVGSPSLKSTENFSSESNLSKEIVSPQYSPINKNEEKKMPAAKRSKRLQRKNKRVEYDKDAISNDTSDCSEKLQINKNEYSSKPENEIKTSNCLNIQFTNDVISVAEVSKDSTKEILESNLSLSSGNSNSVSSKESSVENCDNSTGHPSEQMDESSSGDYQQSKIGKANENVNEKREGLDLCLEVLDKKVPTDSNLSPKANKHLGDQCQSIDQQTFHKLDKKELNVTIPSPLISEETLDKSCGIEQYSQKLDADEDTCNQSKEIVVQNLNDEEQLLALEVPKNELKDNQKQLTSKTKLKASFKQRKSLRKHKESYKNDNHTNIIDQEGENKETEVEMEKMDETPLEKIQPSCSPKLSLRNRKESNKFETHSESVGNVKQCDVVSEKTKETPTKVKEIKHSPSPKPALISEQEIEVHTLDETYAELRVEPIQEVVSNSTSVVVAMDDGLDVGTNLTNIDSNIEIDTDSKSNTETIEQETHLKSKNCPEKPTLAKRKSLRIQKDFSNENVDKESKTIPAEEVTAENTPKDKSSISPTNISIVEISPEVPKRKQRKSRFRNLHGPEDTETEVKNIVDKPNIINEESLEGVIKNVVDKPNIIGKESPQTEEIKNIVDMPPNIIKEKSSQVEEIKNIVHIPPKIINDEISQVGEIENIFDIPELIVEESPQMGQTENILDKPNIINEESPQSVEIKIIADMQPNIINEESPQVEEFKNNVDIPLNIINEESPHVGDIENIIDSPKQKIDESSQMGQTENIFDKPKTINGESPQVEENKNIVDNADVIKKQSPQEEESERIDEKLDEEINTHKKSADPVANSPPIVQINDTRGIEKSTFENVNKNDDIDDDQLDKIYSKNVQTPSPPTTSPTESNTNTYVIQNVSIETNTLLDILRTVQSNKEAAQAEAQKSTHDTPSELSVSSPVVCNNSTDDGLKDTQLKKISDSNSNSPNRSKSASPLTHKKVQQRSPCRSDTSSPSTLKKVNISPCRSDTSSPLTFNKKVTRRYERRSKRGDEDSTHKTLEETFAEIAALSSKAVLEMTTNEVTDTAVTTNEPNEDEIVIPVCGKELILEDNKEKEMVESELKPLPESKTEESIEATPTRKTRQPKRRSTKVSSPMAVTVTDIQEHVTHQIDKESEDPALYKESSIIASDKSVVSETMVKQNISASLSDSNTQPTVSDSHVEAVVQETVGKIIYEPQVCGEITNALIPADKQEDYNTANIVQDEKTPNTSADQTSSVEMSTQMGTTSLEEEPQTPKQTSKRDSSLAKNETKGSNRKSTKKSKPTTAEQLETKASEDKEITTKTSNTPPKKGRRAKTTTPQQDQPNPSIAVSSSSGKKKLSNKEQTVAKEEKEEVEELQQQIQNDVGSDSVFSEIGLHEKSFDEKMAKKKRQRKLKEAFEAALNDKPVDTKQQETLTPSQSPVFGLSFLNKSPPTPVEIETNNINSGSTPSPAATIAVPEPEEDPDPLKDIEKFIEDGVNLLKKDYKIDEDSVDNIIPTKPIENQKNIQNEIEQITEDNLSNKDEVVFNTFETPADTPLATPSATPPPPETPATLGDEEQTSGGVRRSHRIKLITKMPKALVGRGLVRDKERFSIKDDVETKSHYTLDDHLLDLAEVEAKNAKFLKEMEERLSNFQVIKENEYKCERVISREARKMICDCFLTAEEEERGELACGEDCLNRLLMIECGNECNIKERCTNKRFQKFLCSPCRVFRTEKKGFGIMADIEILPGEFIMEYVGEVINTEEFEKRRIAYSQEKNRHYYFMALRSDAIIDATIKGNISRFINHSCDPNAETQKWTVNGELRIGFFSRKSIMPGEEITFDYQYQRYGREAQRCYCESSNCRGWIGQEPNSDEGEQIDDEDESDDEEEEDEEDTTSNLLEDDEDSDASVSDPEEVQKKLEMAAAQAEVELAPIALDEKVTEKEAIISQEPSKEQEESVKPETEEDSKSKFKKLLSKMAEKVAAKHKQTKREQKLQRKKKSKESSAELANKQKSLEDPDIEDEVEFLSRCGLKTQSDTLRLSRLMVRAKLVQTRLNLLNILRKGELPCRRLFLDYHGLRLVHGWMSEDAGNMQIRLALLQTLELLPIANKTVLTDSKVMQVVRNWCGSTTTLSPNDDSQSSSSNSQDGTAQSINSGVNIQENTDCIELQKLALKLITTWDGLPEIFRIPKKERIEQMKEHEREADRQYAETEGDRYSSDQYRSNRFGRRLNTTTTSRFAKPHNTNPNSKLQQQNMRTPNVTPENAKCLSKTQRREMFAAKVARDEAEKRMAEERREFETKCRFFGLDPKKTRPQDVPFCVNPATGQWYSVDRKSIATPPSYAHVQVPVKPKSTNPVDYQLPPVCSTLPPQWKFAITPLGQIYYYHVQYRIPQWEPPSPAQLQLCCESNIDDGDSGNEHTPTTGPDSSDDDDDILIGMDAAQLKAYIDRKVEMRRQKRYQRLVDERAISPRREEDRMYNQLEVRKYKENKEKIRKRKEEIRRKRAEALRQSSLNMCTLGSLSDTNSGSLKIETDEDMAGVLPIQDYLLSSDEDEDIKAEINSPLIDKIVEGDKIVDELDALTTKRPLKRPLPSHRDLNEPSTSSSSAAAAAAAAAVAATIANERQEYKKRKMEKKEKRKPKEQDAKYRKTKEKFRCEIAGIIVHHLRPYRKDSCTVGRIKSNEDFNHLARKLTHFVMIKELKYCESVGQTLVVTESVKNKSREFIKKYMAKYADVYVKPANDPEFKDIPFTL